MRAYWLSLGCTWALACNGDDPVDVGEASSSSSAGSSGASTAMVPRDTTGSSGAGTEVGTGMSSGGASSTGSGSDGGSTSTAGSGGGSTSTAGSSDGGSTSTGGSSDSGGSGTTGGGPPGACVPYPPDLDMLCQDGTIVAGELCYEVIPPLQPGGGLSATRVWAGDLDDDADNDAIILVEFPAAMTVLLGDGLGTLVFDDTYGLVAGEDTGSRDVDVADMDGDTFVDAVVAFASPPSLLVLTNDGGGAFGFPIVTPLAMAPNAVALTDFDGDGNNDALVADDVGLTLYYGLGNGSFGMSASAFDPALAVGRDLALGDFDGDLDTDVAVAFTQAVAVFPNDAGMLGVPVVTAVMTSMTGPDDIAVGDPTVDGVLDLAVADGANEELHLLEGMGNGSFVPGLFPNPGRLAAIGEATADCNDDLLTMTLPVAVELLTIYPSDGAGGIVAGGNFQLHDGVVDIEVADFDGDEIVDVLFARGPTGQIGLSLNEF